MKIVAINGSPRGKSGNTFIMVEEFLKGARNAGADCDHILLAEKKIHHCMGCFTCWTKTPGHCAISDDMTDLIPRLKSDMVVFASPVYVDNVTGLMKNFMDRLVPTALPYFELDERGEARHICETEQPKIIVISNCGFPEQSHFQVISHLFKRVARNMHSEVVAEIYRGEGELLKSKNLLLIPILYRYRKLLNKAGREVTLSGRLSSDTRAELEQPLISYSRYLKGANKAMDEALAEKKS